MGDDEIQLKGDEFSDSQFHELENWSRVDLARHICDLEVALKEKDKFIEGFCFEIKEQRKAIKTLLAALEAKKVK